MQALLFGDGFSKPEKIIFRKMFKALTKELNIKNKDASVELHRVHLGRPTLWGSSVAHEGWFRIDLNTNEADMFRDTSCFGHEMIHVAQELHGVMTSIQDENPGVWWKGKFYPCLLIDNLFLYGELPWEIEAHSWQDKLHEIALAALTTKERNSVLASKSENSEHIGPLKEIKGLEMILLGLK